MALADDHVILKNNKDYSLPTHLALATDNLALFPSTSLHVIKSTPCINQDTNMTQQEQEVIDKGCVIDRKDINAEDIQACTDEIMLDPLDQSWLPVECNYTTAGDNSDGVIGHMDIKEDHDTIHSN